MRRWRVCRATPPIREVVRTAEFLPCFAGRLRLLPTFDRIAAAICRHIGRLDGHQ